MTRRRTIHVADLFCGAGGTSTGALRAIEALGHRVDMAAINHWPTAIDTHSRNHPGVRHLCARLEDVRPLDVFPGGKLDLLIAAPSCTHHSMARGGRPTSDQQRACPWTVITWLTELRVSRLLLENVPEFRSWGPIDPKTGKPVESRKGEYYRAWLRAIRGLGMKVDAKIVNCADHGDATTRRRLIVQACARHLELRWPEPTHAKPGSLDICMGRKPWRPAREIIDWALPSQSIFDRKKPLAAATMNRIAVGLKRHGGIFAPAFLLVLRRHMDGRPLDEPLPTLCAGGNHVGLVEPIATPVADQRELAFVLGQHGGSVARSVDEPIPTVATGGALSVVEPVLVIMRGKSTARPVDQPIPTLSTMGNLALAEPFLARVNGADKPSPFMARFDDGRTAVRPPISIDDPVPTLTTKLGFGVVEPFVMPYYGTAVADPVDEPLATVTTKSRFGIVEPKLEPVDADPASRLPVVHVDGIAYRVDVRFRMLHRTEIAAATGFPADYDFAGNQSDVHKQIGNAVPVHTAAAIVGAMMGG